MIKVCGITRRQDAVAAVEAGASAIGFVFYPKSPRYVTPEKAAELGSGLAAWKVGVFVDEKPAVIEEIMRLAHLDIAQIYGGAAPSFARVWKAFRIPPSVDGSTDASFDASRGSGAEVVLLDGSRAGVSFDWGVARTAAQEGARKIVIAGGLDASNVAEAIRMAHPWGVDASSRLESAPGVKDHEKVRQFVKAAQEAE